MNSICLPEIAACAALIPCYEGGNAVKVVYSDGRTSLIYRSIKTVMRSLERDSSIDIVSFRKKCDQTVNRKKLIPIPLSLNDVMVPVKVRKALNENDGTFAYLNIKYPCEITGDENAVIKLVCDTEITAIESSDIVRMRFKMGNIVKERYCSDVLKIDSMMSALKDMNDDYEKPALRSDIALLLHELMLIRNRIESNIK